MSRIHPTRRARAARRDNPGGKVIPIRRAALAVLLAALAAPAGARAQSLLDRPPNLSGAWVGNPGTLYFHFLHRFSSSPAPTRKVANVPTFTVAAGLPYRMTAGLHYATNSALAPGFPNEWELWGRHQLFSQDRGAPADLGAQVAFNNAANGVDGEVSVARRFAGLRLVASGRVLSDPMEAGARRYAVAGGGTLKISRYFAVAGDVATLQERREGEEVAWSAGLHLAIPQTPHSLSLQASNSNAYTLQGMSFGGEDVRYGFEFTVPLTLARWFGPRAVAGPVPPPPSAPVAGSTPAAAPAGPVTRAGMRNFAYTPARIEIPAGSTVEWTNGDQMAHTVTATSGAFDSGLIQPGARWSHTFSEAGTYDFTCTPHPFMKGVVIVR
ncbi:cupredoxin family copper-binding protein [Longimicrobium sp.]|uniref:cupredoxin domain-containing protein n=1 Tax=Longimicrobium sp. TaxID=2029185 RepID=UPI002F949D47